MNERKEINILSFDGGGTRGVMEVFILDDIMKMATMLRNSPKKIYDITCNYEVGSGTLFESPEERQCFFEELDAIPDQIQAKGKLL